MNVTIGRQNIRDNAVVAIREDDALLSKDLAGVLILVVVMIVVLLLTSGSAGG